MKTKVVGLFQSAAQAQQVFQELVSQGLDKGAIQLLADDGQVDEAAGKESSGSKGFFARLGDMLGLTGDEDERARLHEGVRHGGVLIVVNTPDGQAERVVGVLQRHGAVNIDEHAESWRKAGATAADTAAKSRSERVPDSVSAKSDEVTLPVIEEELRVGKRVVQRGGVRIYTSLTEHPVEEKIRLREEHVNVERHAVDRPVTDAELRSFKQGTFELSERAEEVVVSKQARIVEEVVVSKQVDEHIEVVHDSLRRTDVQVEALPKDAPAFETYSADFQQHFTASFAHTGGGFDQYIPAYRYGLGLAADSRYRSVDWTVFEADARRSWEERAPGTWERFKDAIKYAWEKVPRKVMHPAVQP